MLLEQSQAGAQTILVPDLPRDGDEATLDRPAQEVVAILTQLSDGEPTGFLADDFITIPIRNSALDEIRESFDQLALCHPQWEPQMPFPEAGAQELQILIERAKSLAPGQG